jgi:ubiquinone/menaquinone biosynthesis C-methylase UbiE
MGFKDYFSGHAARYRDARPTYPAELWQWLASQCAEHKTVWDAACGNGQAAIALVEHFDDVFASDASHAQIAHAIAHPDIQYRHEPAEECGLSDATADLVVIAQALHWVDRGRFYAEARRVLKPGGVIAAVGYGLMSVTPSLDHAIARLYDGILGPYWAPERRLVDDGYKSIEFPFSEFAAPHFIMSHQWKFEQLMGYLESWSALQKCRKETGGDPLKVAHDLLEADWGDKGSIRTVTWPLAVRVGRT